MGPRDRPRTAHPHRPPGRVSAVAFAPDGATLASAGDDGTVKLWDPATGHELRTLTGHQGGVSAVAFAPDGATLASAGNDGTVKLWDPATGRQLRTLTGHRGWVAAVAFAPDGATLASAGDDGTVKLWDPATGHELRTLTGHPGLGPRRRVQRPTARPSRSAGQRRDHQAVGSRDRPPAAHPHQPPGGVRAVAFAPDGATLATAGNDGTVKLWDADGTTLATLIGTGEGWIAYAPDGRYKLEGQVAPDRFWWAIGLCRFAPGELDAHLPAGTLTRVAVDEPLWSRDPPTPVRGA